MTTYIDKPSSGLTAPDAAIRALASGDASVDSISEVTLSSIVLPLRNPISDAKVLTGRQKAMTEVVFLFVEIRTEQGHEGIGFSYSKRAGGPAQFAHAQEIAPVLIGEDPNDIGKVWTKLVWAGASVGRSGVATQAIAAIDIALWDLKAKRAGLPLAKLIGASRDSVQTYNTSGGFLHTPIEEVMDNAARSLANGIGGIKLKVGQPDWRTDIARVTAVREFLGDDVPLMVDANQQWDRPTANRMCRILEQFDLVWIEAVLEADVLKLLGDDVIRGKCHVGSSFDEFSVGCQNKDMGAYPGPAPHEQAYRSRRSDATTSTMLGCFGGSFDLHA